MWAWQIGTSTLTKSTVFSHTITLIFWPEAGCWDWLRYFVIHHSIDINFESLRPEIILCLVVYPDRLGGTIDYSDFRIINVLRSTHITVIHNIDDLIRPSNSIRKWKVWILPILVWATLISSCALIILILWCAWATLIRWSWRSLICNYILADLICRILIVWARCCITMTS